jgi:hypothetical protein
LVAIVQNRRRKTHSIHIPKARRTPVQDNWPREQTAGSSSLSASR